jgi:hypothetical protein
MVVGLACGSGAGGTITTPAANQTPSGQIVPLEMFGAPNATPGAACASGKFRDFDFWVGNWNIFTPTNQPAGVSIISRELGGCAVKEFYQNGSGQSLSTYDTTTDTWNQFYVFSGPGILLLRGSLVNREMVLSEQRTPTLLDRWTWSAVHRDTVWQRDQVMNNGTASPGFEGKYARRSDAPSGAPNPAPGCPTAHPLAFLAGDWKVYEGDPNASGTFRGTVKATAELRGCAIIEQVSGASSFAGLSFAAVHPVQSKVLREYMDTDGRYLRLTGSLEGKQFVATGSKKALDGSTVTVRMTYEPVSPNELKQSWEFSRDGGATFTGRRELRFIK